MRNSYILKGSTKYEYEYSESHYTWDPLTDGHETVKEYANLQGYANLENIISLDPLILLAAINNLSDVSFVAPYKLTGAQALSVESATTFFTLHLIAAAITFSAPFIFVLMHSEGLYSDK